MKKLKTLFIDAKSEVEIEIPESELDKLQGFKKIGAVTTLQHYDKVKEAISKGKIPNVILGGKILGCNVDAAKKIEKNIDAFLYIGTGRFHPIKVALETGKEVFMFDPLSKKITRIEEQEIKKIKQQIKVGITKFLSSREIGFLVSTKKGQQNLKAAKLLEKKYPDKNFHVFAFNTLDLLQLDNFPFIECWVNTACPRIIEDFFVNEKRNVVNAEDLIKREKEK